MRGRPVVLARLHLYFDEWTFINTAPDWTLATYFRPHNEHPSMLFRAVYAALLNTVGLRSYVPYMTLLLLGHFANVLLLFELVRRRAGQGFAIAASALLLAIGAAGEGGLWSLERAWMSQV